MSDLNLKFGKEGICDVSIDNTGITISSPKEFEIIKEVKNNKNRIILKVINYRRTK